MNIFTIDCEVFHNVAPLHQNKCSKNGSVTAGGALVVFGLALRAGQTLPGYGEGRAFRPYPRTILVFSVSTFSAELTADVAVSSMCIKFLAAEIVAPATLAIDRVVANPASVKLPATLAAIQST